MRRLLLLAAAAAVAALTAATAMASTPQLRADLSGYPRVRVTVVTPRAGNTPPTLTENGRHIDGLEALNLGGEKAVVLAIDRSRSMRGQKFADAVTALRGFVALKPPADEIALDAFGSRPLQLSGLQQATIDVDTALRTLNIDSRYGTALYDAVVVAAGQLSQPLQGRVLILLTDGANVGGRATLAGAVAAVRRDHVTVYPVALGRDAALRPLQTLARASGGRLYQASSSTTLADIYRQIDNELAHTWLLSYATASRPGDLVHLAVDVDGVHSSLQARAPGVAAPAAATSDGALGGAPVAVIAAMGGLLLAFALLLVLRRPRIDRLRQLVAAQIGASEQAQPKAQRRRLLARMFAATERNLGTLGIWRRAAVQVERSGLPVRTVEFVYVATGCAVAAGLVSAVAALPSLLIVLFFLVGGGLPFAVVSFLAKRRQAAFANQLPDLLAALAAALRAGHSIKQALGGVVEEVAEPARSEFARALAEARLGQPLEEGLDALATRIGSDELDYVVTAIAVQAEAGGSLAQLFEMVSETVRQRHQHARRLHSLTATGRASAYVLVSLPFGLLALLSAINPSFVAPLFHDHIGQMLLSASAVMIAIGAFFLRRIVSAAH